ncbi:DUF6177 family protein [Streptomyces lomondensis]|uniref:Uncharacterized protein n=1 Tax=Streptomyces lomondensis TaxID=68229 RepID=A0ABQ2WXR9_9ACTN|nr:DUF6177 family protein [Streptomyces lomondensis]MCF0079128.1 DUF6177 family protein [Streptomyces lomondensis]GGW82828.1 hypothetical protein GCM10010383_08960 [Streptomyces lomondensis]
MTKDVIALTPRMPDLPTLLAGLFAGGPDLGVNTTADGAVVQLCGPDGRPLVSVEAPILVQVPGETSRLLDHAVEEGPVWWTEARASTAVAEAGRLAGSFAGRLATVLGGTVWPPEAATTDVVPLTTDVSAVPAPATGAPAVDVLTATTAVVIQDRPLIAMTSWLSDALRAATSADRALQIVTPPTARLTLPTRTALRGLPNRWVVQDPEHGYYDGLSGAVLHWRNGTFTPVPGEQGATRVAEAFTPTPDTGDRQLILTLRTRHPADENLVLGRALETAFRHLTGAPPAGWSTAEPVNLPWSTRQLTDLARARAPRPTWLIALGQPDRPSLATMRVLRTPAGVEEDITLALGYGCDEAPPLDAAEELATALDDRHGLVTLLTALRTARRDLTVPPSFEAPPIPVAFTLGSDEADAIGPARAGHPPLGPLPARLGPEGRPALHYLLGDGSDPHAWSVFQHLVQHLKRG